MANDERKAKPSEKISRPSSIQPKPSVLMNRDDKKRIEKSKISTISPSSVKLESAAIPSLKKRGYKIIGCLGEGNYSQVYHIVTKSSKEMAVKIIDLNKVSNHYKMRFLPRELDIISRLKHDGIIQVRGTSYTRDRWKIFS